MLLFCLILLGGISRSSTSIPADVLAALDSQISKVVRCHGLAGLSLTVVKDGETLFHSGYGHADLASRAPVTPDTLYAIGSVSKQFASFLLEYYQEQGLLDLVQPIAPQLAKMNHEFKLTDGEENEEINVQDLLSHRTGLPNYMGLEFLGNNTREQLFQDLFYSKQDTRQPYRESWHYNNWLYVAAARIGEIMSGRTFEEDLQSLVFSKLGMGAGTLSDRAYLGRNLHRLAKPYVFDQSEVNRNVGDNMWVRTWNPSMTPAGGLLASGRDMAKWMNLLLSGGVLNSRQRLVQSQTINNMFRKLSDYDNWTQTFKNWSSKCVGYGEGWFLFTCPLDHNNAEYSHTGNFYSVHYSKINLYPEQKLGIFYAFSGGNSTLNRRLFSVIDLLILDMVLNGHLNPRISREVNDELESWPGCQTNDFPSNILRSKGPSQQQSLGGHVTDQDGSNHLRSRPKIRPRLFARYLGVFRHPFLGTAELRYDDEQNPRLVLNDEWTSRVYVDSKKYGKLGRRRSGNDTDSIVLHCFFDNIPWLPDHSRDDYNNEMEVEIERLVSPNSKLQKLIISKWLKYSLKAVIFTRVKD